MGVWLEKKKILQAYIVQCKQYFPIALYLHLGGTMGGMC